MFKTILIIGVVLGVLKLCAIPLVAGVGWGLIAALVFGPYVLLLLLFVLHCLLEERSGG